MNELYAECRICPRECGVDRTAESGYCGCGCDMRIARIAPHLWEEPFLSGIGLEETVKGSGAVFFCGCNLGCVYCQNHRISRIPAHTRTSVGRIYTPSELADELLRLEQMGVHNIDLITAAHYLPSVAETIELARLRGLCVPVVYNTGGYEKVSSLKLLRGLVDIYLPDMKYISTVYSSDYSNASDYAEVAKAAIWEMYSQTGEPRFDESGFMLSGTAVRHLVLPGCDADSVRVVDWLYGEFGSDGVTLSIMDQYTPIPELAEGFPELTEKLPRRAYLRVVEHAQALGFRYLYTQGDGAASESYIPDFGI